MEVRNSDGMTVWVPNEAFEFLQKIWKPEYQWAPVPVDKALARAPEQIAFIQTPTPGPDSPTPSTATELESPRTPRDSLKPRSNYTALPPPSTGGASGPSKPALQLSNLEYLGNGNYQPPQGPWPSVDDWRGYQQDNTWRGYQHTHDLHPGGWEAVDSRRALPMPGDLPSAPGPWKLEDGRGNYRRKAGTRAAAWKTLDGSRRDLDTNDNFVTRKQTDTAWHGSKKGFALRMDMHLNVEVQMKGSVSGDITLSAEALYAL
ncbi:hypothetical protein UCDDA912_g09419 [Diaporthe ampelina]|uniref:Uncharacterized protein n=1 Tax=Diaporthe ampelina TaxID=1214573 RepID=A0A0G2F8V9_9PEZI|nr:hypothetical protein UCDDA912_g09419 [Diaporthe ampelina]